MTIGKQLNKRRSSPHFASPSRKRARVDGLNDERAYPLLSSPDPDTPTTRPTCVLESARVLDDIDENGGAQYIQPVYLEDSQALNVSGMNQQQSVSTADISLALPRALVTSHAPTSVLQDNRSCEFSGVANGIEIEGDATVSPPAGVTYFPEDRIAAVHQPPHGAGGESKWSPPRLWDYNFPPCKPSSPRQYDPPAPQSLDPAEDRASNISPSLPLRSSLCKKRLQTSVELTTETPRSNSDAMPRMRPQEMQRVEKETGRCSFECPTVDDVERCGVERPLHEGEVIDLCGEGDEVCAETEVKTATRPIEIIDLCADSEQENPNDSLGE